MARAAPKRERDSMPLGGLDSPARRPLAHVNDGRLLRAVSELESQARRSTDLHKAARLTLRTAASLFSPDAACIALMQPGQPQAVIFQEISPVPGPCAWDLPTLSAFIMQRRVAPEPQVALARLKRRGRPWGAIVLRWNAAEPDWSIRNALTQLAASANRVIDELERDRVLDVRARIDRKIMEQLRPKDLFYQIIDGLRSLTGYDHSAMLLTAQGTGALEIAAEQLAWRKGRSRRVGSSVPIAPDLVAKLSRGRAWCFSRQGERCDPHDQASPIELAAWLAAPIPDRPTDEPPESEVICAPLHVGDQLAAVLRLSTQHPGTFGLYECGLVEQLLPQATVALQNTRRTQKLEDELIQAERKHAMADLARGVSHDVNNALGAILPLVQQLREEAQQGTLRPGSIDKDLEQIEKSVQTCRRIFGGMLAFARRTHTTDGATGSLTTALEAAMAILGDSLARHRIQVVRDLPANLPALPLTPVELEQIFLNLIGNARDAMRNHAEGVLTIRATVIDAGPGASPTYNALRLEIADTGCGVSREHLSAMFEPFFTTKPSGSGLGLAVCRSIISGVRGELRAESPATQPERPTLNKHGPGTRIIVHLPLPAEPRS